LNQTKVKFKNQKKKNPLKKVSKKEKGQIEGGPDHQICSYEVGWVTGISGFWGCGPPNENKLKRL
jgi:hypothetical protein